jgi:hypothetical protein
LGLSFMSQQTIGIGDAANDGTGDPLRTAFMKCNNNFTELYGAPAYQPLDADLTALAALAGTNVIYYRSAANTWSPVTVGDNLTFTGGTLAAASAPPDFVGSVSNPLAVTTGNLALNLDGTLRVNGSQLGIANNVVLPGNVTIQGKITVAGASGNVIGDTTGYSYVGLYQYGTVVAVTARACASQIDTNLTAAANNDVLEGLRVSPTWTPGAFTGISRRAIVVPATCDYAFYSPNLGKVTIGDLLDLSLPAAGQIKFPATPNPSSDDNTLDTYKEGTWIPAIAGTTTPGSNTYTTQEGTYVKIGQMVIASFFIQMSAKDAAMAGIVWITGLPFASAAFSRQGCGVADFGGFATAMAYVAVQIQSAQNTMFITYLNAAGATSIGYLPPSEVTATTWIGGTICYRAAA